VECIDLCTDQYIPQDSLTPVLIRPRRKEVTVPLPWRTPVVADTGAQFYWDPEQGEKKTNPGPQQSGPASPDDRGSTQSPAKRQMSAGDTPGNGGQRGPRLQGIRVMPKLLGRVSRWRFCVRVIRRFRSPNKILLIFNQLSVGLWMNSLKRASPIICIGPKGRQWWYAKTRISGTGWPAAYLP